MNLHKTGNNLSTIFLALLILLSFATSASADAAADFLLNQLQTLSKNRQLQKDDVQSATIIDNFVKTQKGQPQNQEFSPESIAAIEAFFKFAFSNSEDAANVMRILQLAGKLGVEKADKTHKGPFSEHVLEAIAVNRKRAEYYAQASKGRTRGLSRLYTSLEAAIVPMAKIFDRWANGLWKKGIPVMKNDFVSMKDIPTADACPARMGRLSQQGIADYLQVLRSFRKNTRRAAFNKDFIALQVHAISALHQLKALQEIHRCNLTLSIHLVESIGLAARNADQLKQQHKAHREIDSFYRALILSQIFGTRMFAGIDIKAQPFHQAGIGIIVNDLPRIPFPAKQ